MKTSNELSREEKLIKVKEYAAQAKSDPVVLTDRFFYTFNPKVPPYHFPFRLFDFQKKLVSDLKSAVDEGYDIFVEKARDLGCTYSALSLFLWYWLYVPGSNFLLGSRKEAYVDNTRGESGELSNKEESLFGKLEYILKHLAPFMLPKGFDFRKHFTYMSLVNPENGNSISGESSNPNFSRGGRFKAIILDEFAFWDNDSAAWGATADTTNCRIVLTTPGIRPGKAKRLRFGKDGEKIKVLELDYSLDPRKTEEWLGREKDRRSKEDFAREIQRNWESSVAGRVYDEIQFSILGNFPYEPSWPLYVTWDFGLDGTAIQYWQPNPYNGKLRIIDSYSNSDKPIQFFFPLFGNPVDSYYNYLPEDLEAIQALKDLKRAVHFGDPDVSKRSFVESSAVSARTELSKIGIHVQTRPEANDFYTRRDRTKVMLQGGVEVNNTIRNEYWLESMKNARYPQRLETSQATSEITLPIHDWTSHHRTATEYFAVNYHVVKASEQANSYTLPTNKWEGGNERMWKIGV